MACALGCWLLAQVVARLGACSWRLRSPTSGSSWRAASQAPTESTGVALVAETLGLGCRGVGSLAGITLSGKSRAAVDE